MVTGRRYGGPEAVAAGIVGATHPLERLRDEAVAIAADHTATAGPVLSGIKRSLHRATHDALLGART